MNISKPRSVISMIVLFIVASNVIVPTVYNATVINEEKTETRININDIKSVESNRNFAISANADSKLNIGFNFDVNSLFGNVKYFLINKQLDIAQVVDSPLHKNIINNETQVKKTGVFSNVNAVRTVSNSEVINERYEVHFDNRNSILRINSRKLSEKSIGASEIITKQFLNLKNNFKSRDGPRIVVVY